MPTHKKQRIYKEWIEEIDINIDYFSAFLKAWIAFNSWYRFVYSERTDRDIIERIKTQSNSFKGYIETLLDTNNNSETATSFKENLSLLQSSLTSASIVTQERGGVSKQISFSAIAINNPKSEAEGDYRRTHYKIKRSREEVKTIVSKKGDPTIEYFRFEQDEYDETALDNHEDFKKMRPEQRGQCKAFYKEVRPYVTESVLQKDENNKVIFISERSKVSRGVIEVLYLLRCSLMHGEVSPDSNSRAAYKYAYYILSAILKEMK